LATIVRREEIGPSLSRAYNPSEWRFSMYSEMQEWKRLPRGAIECKRTITVWLFREETGASGEPMTFGHRWSRRKKILK